jgi:hydroxymethylpyrimidine/phosphomethylpyrimidine kinase
VAAGEHGTRFVLVTGVMLASKGTEQFIDNVLASPQGAIAGEKFERFDTAFVGAGDTLAPRWPRCWPPAASCRPRWAKRCPSWTRAWTRASAPAWATSCRTASSGPCRPPTRKAQREDEPGARQSPNDPKGKGSPRRVH